MRFETAITTLILATALAFGTVQGEEVTPAQDAKPAPEGDHPHRKSMSDEERAAMRARHENMSEEEKQAMRDKRAERRAKWQSMSEEERQAAREKFRQHRADRPRPEGQGRPEPAPDGA